MQAIHGSVGIPITESSKYNSSTNFNELRFEDKMGQEQVFINAERDMGWRVENDQREFRVIW